MEPNMAKQKANQKYGRNSRSNSGKLQRQRTDKNKRLRIERAQKTNPKSIGHICPKKNDLRVFVTIVWRAQKERVYVG
jgi:hypothetical protein